MRGYAGAAGVVEDGTADGGKGLEQWRQVGGDCPADVTDAVFIDRDDGGKGGETFLRGDGGGDRRHIG